ncbi:heavy metal translocating P-type ATPase [Desulfitibacter alkalitolerans]|uniref:heavy metal translocating P-type ATPase n=1 Tax=Desulfitibacter alkalitolerans TaxID=264641 RepID=UPI000688D580|nr:heavy metal translocating P-type ATPase [Desulfitibacter alkalitolerans]
MINSARLIHLMPGRVRIYIGKRKERPSLIESRCRQFPPIYSANYSMETGSLLIYYHSQVPVRLIIQWLLEQFNSSAASGQSTNEFKGFSQLARSNVAKSGVAVAVYLIERFLLPGQLGTTSGFLRLFRPATFALLFAASDIIKEGFSYLFNKKKVNADTLTAVALLAASYNGKSSSALTIVLLSRAGELLTKYTAQRTRNHIINMLRLDVPYVWLVEDNGRERKVHIDSVKSGQTISVFLGEKISVDGTIVKGAGSVDESPITGEYLPKEVYEGSYVYAGSILKSGQVQIAVKNVGDDTAITRIIKLIEEAQNKQAPIQSYADKMAQALVPVSFIMAGIVLFLTKDWNRVMNMLFIDYACGLKLSTTTAISAAIGKAAKQGILIKGGQYLESLSKVDTVVFDKTGTVTEGEPVINRIYSFNNYTEEDVLRYAASAEEHSSHPVASAIVNRAQELGLSIPDHGKVVTVIGRGIMAEVDKGNLLVGSDVFMEEEQMDITALKSLQGLDFKSEKNSLIYVAYEGKLMGIISIYDPVRFGMKRTINQLRRYGVDEIILLTGDKRHNASRISSKLLLDDFFAEALPEDKANLIRMYKQRGNTVMMVGDGINDAPALAYADVGITLGGKRTDIAMEASDVIIIPDDPLQLPNLIRLSQNSLRIINQNFITTVAINSLALMLGAMGTITPVLAAVIHNVATIGVVINSSKILFMEMPKNEK